MRDRLLRKALVLTIIVLFVGASVFPVAGIVDKKENVIENLIQVESELQYGVTSGVDEWPMFHHDPENTGYSTSNAPKTNTIKWIYNTGFVVDSCPSVVNGKVYISSADEHFYCLNADTGQKLWKYYISGLSCCSPAVYDGKVYVDSAYDYFYCFDADTGDLIWTFYKGYRFSGPAPVVVDGKVYFAHSRGGGAPGLGQNASLYCLDADTGYKLWKSHDMGWFELSSPAVYNGKVYIGSEDHKMYCFNADTGSILWDFETGYRVFSSPAVFDEKVYFGSEDGKFYCLNASTGDEIWDFQAGWIICSPAVFDEKVYFGSEDGKFYCLNASTGDEIWDYTTNGGFFFSSPAVADGKVYVASYWSRRLLFLDAYSGEFFWSYTLSDFAYITSSPAVAYGRVFIGGGLSYKVYCFEDLPAPPNKPTITGETNGKKGVIYEYTFNAVDPNGDDVRYHIDWGDGKFKTTRFNSSGTDVKAKHIWYEEGTYTIKATAEDTNGLVGPEGTLTVTMPRNRVINRPFLNFLQQHPNMFPILRHLLRL